MNRCPSRKQVKPREWRRKMVLPARMRASCGWSNACILNVSSRGLLIQASRGAFEGSTVEIWHGEQVIVARVVWRQGTRAGLQAEARVPIEDMCANSSGAELPRTGPDGHLVERRKRPRTHEQNRFRGRAVEFASLAVVGLALATGMFALVEQAFAQPLAYIARVMGG